MKGLKKAESLDEFKEILNNHRDFEGRHVQKVDSAYEYWLSRSEDFKAWEDSEARKRAEKAN
ncbi:MAG: hypothetical protein WD449_01910 [Candidatus Babeliales bacterium]